MPKKETFTSRFEETRGGRVPQKSKIWGDVVYGWSLIKKEQELFFSATKTVRNTAYIPLKNRFDLRPSPCGSRPAGP